MFRKFLKNCIVGVCLIICSLVLLYSLNNSISYASTSFISYGKPVSIGYNKKEIGFNYDDDDEDLKLSIDSQHILRLYNKKKDVDFLSFIPQTGNGIGVEYSVREVHTKNPKMTFYEIIANRGAHGQNCGYWLIGKSNGKWVTFVSCESLVGMGYNTNEWHQISSNINAVDNLVLKSTHKSGNINITDLRVKLFWDENAKWFGLSRMDNEGYVSSEAAYAGNVYLGVYDNMWETTVKINTLNYNKDRWSIEVDRTDVRGYAFVTRKYTFIKNNTGWIYSWLDNYRSSSNGAHSVGSDKLANDILYVISKYIQ